MSELNIKVMKYLQIMLNNVQIQQHVIANCITTECAVPERSINKYCELSLKKLISIIVVWPCFQSHLWPQSLGYHFHSSCNCTWASSAELYLQASTGCSIRVTWVGRLSAPGRGFTLLHVRKRGTGFSCNWGKPEWENQQQHKRSWDSSRGSVKADSMLHAASNI